MKKIDSDSTARSLTLIISEADRSNYKNIPENYHQQCLRYLTLNKAQFAFERFKQGKLSSSVWDAYKKRLPPADTLLLYNGFVEGNKFGVFSALDTVAGQKIFVIDANRNFDFSDDQIMKIKLDTIDKMKTYPFETVLKAQYLLDGKIHDQMVPIKIFPYQPALYNNDTLQQKLGIAVANGVGLKGAFQKDGYTYQMISTLPKFGLPPLALDDFEVYVKKYDKDQTQVDENDYHGSDTLFFGDQMYKIQKYDLETSQFSLLNVGRAIFGSTTGTSLKKFVANDFITKKPIDWAALKNKKNILLDFWGSWCVPCIEGMPKLKAVSQSNRKILEVISFAYDNIADTLALKKIITDKEMKWSHVWVERNSKQASQNTIKDLKVRAFPTFILIDAKTNRILYRGESESALVEIEKYIKK